MNILTYQNQFSDELSCKKHFLQTRIENGVICKKCQSKDHYWLASKEQFQCKSCSFRTTLRSGTVLEHSKLPYSYWYLAIHLLTTSKKSFSAHELRRQIGHKRYEPIWALLHKIRQHMGKVEDNDTLKMAVVVDDAYIPTNTTAQEKIQTKRGKGTNNKSKVTTAIETIPLSNKGKESYFCGKLKLKVNPSEKAKEAEEIVKNNIDSKSIVFTDSATAFNRLNELVDLHIKINGKEVSNPIMRWTNIIIANLKRYLLGTFHCVKEKYLQNYLNEFAYKFNKRKNPKIFEYTITSIV